MKKILLSTIFLVALTVSASAQGYYSFFQLRDLVPQTQNLQPTFIPNNSFTFALPAINFGVNVSGDFELRDVLSKPAGSNDYTVDFDVLLEATDASNLLRIDATNNIFHLGFKTKNGGISFFANTRVSVDFQYNDDLIDLLANGNANKIGQEISFDGTRFMANAYHEVGVGYARRFLGERLTVGARVKLVHGLFHGSLKEGATGSILTNATDYSWRVNVANGTLNTAGFDLLFNDDDYPDNELTNYLTWNDNSGVAFDLGASFKVTDKLTVEASVNDIGSINWKEQTINYNTADTSVVFSGVQLRNLENADQVLQDSIESKFRSNETNESFKTTLAKRSYLAVNYMLTEKDRLTLMAYNNHSLGEIDPGYAVSYNRIMNKFTFGLIGIFRGRGAAATIGANLASNIGPVQLYMATDNILIFNKPEEKSKVDLRFGINLMFGYKKWKNTKNEVVDLDEL